MSESKNGAMTAKDAAKYCAMSISTMQRLVRQGAFPAPRVLGLRRVAYLTSELDAWLVSRPVSDLLPPENTGAAKPRSAQGALTAS